MTLRQRSQGINSYDIDHILLKYSSLHTKTVKLVEIFIDK